MSELIKVVQKRKYFFQAIYLRFEGRKKVFFLKP